MTFSWVDGLILATVAISALISLMRGFIKEALSLVTWVVAAVITWMFAGSLAQYLTPYIDTPSLRVISAGALLFCAALMTGGLLNFLLTQLVRATGLSGTDRFLGMFFGAARGGLLAVVAVGLLSLSPAVHDAWWRDSTLIPHFLLVADWSKNFILGFSSSVTN